MTDQKPFRHADPLSREARRAEHLGSVLAEAQGVAARCGRELRGSGLVVLVYEVYLGLPANGRSTGRFVIRFVRPEVSGFEFHPDGGDDTYVPFACVRP